MAHGVVRLNAEGVTQSESMIQPQPGGNCLNWVVGHLLAIYHHVLPLLRQEPVLAPASLKRYDRGSPPIRDAADALELFELMAAWDECARRIDAGLAAVPPESLGAPAPFSPTNDPKETVGSLLSTVVFHQAYHAGQTGVLRRIVGKEGAIR
jgi:uncharacterized damage-inducible protein DinB